MSAEPITCVEYWPLKWSENAICWTSRDAFYMKLHFIKNLGTQICAFVATPFTMAADIITAIALGIFSYIKPQYAATHGLDKRAWRHFEWGTYYGAMTMFLILWRTLFPC